MTFSKALLLAALSASATQAKRGKMFETNAFVTPKRDNTQNMLSEEDEMEPYLKQNMLNLRQVDDGSLGHDLFRTIKTGGEEDVNTHIISTSDINNYFNLQVTTELFFGSESEPHNLILDTGSMVSTYNAPITKQVTQSASLFMIIVDLGLDKRLLVLRYS